MYKVIFAALAIVLLLASCGGGSSSLDQTRLLSHTEGDPFVTTLFAGQTMDVGDVEVWNDATNIHVTYVLDEFSGWKLTQTHLDIETSYDGFPVAGNGNPIPGQFTYSGNHDNLTTVSYTIPNIYAVDQAVYIAAHAKVCSLNGGVPTRTYLAEIFSPSEGNDRPPTALFQVSWDGANNGYDMEYVGSLVPDTGAAFYSSHIAISPDGQYIYGIDNGSGGPGGLWGQRANWLCKYEVATGITTPIGNTGVGGITQLGFNIESGVPVLYAAVGSNLYTIDTATAVATSKGHMYTDPPYYTTWIQIGGADLVFREDALYVLTNTNEHGNAVNGLYKVDISASPMTAENLWDSNNSFTGLADTFDGTGNLIASVAQYNNHFGVFIDPFTAGPVYKDMLNSDGTGPYSPKAVVGWTSANPNHDGHYWGDMTSLPAPTSDPDCETGWGDGPDFGGSNWATYFTYTIQ